MRNIFILYIPSANYEAQVHYQDTIENRVEPSRIFRYVDFNLQSKLKGIFGNRNIAVWGSRDSVANRSKFERMQAGDDILIVEGDTIKLLGKFAAKTINPDMSRELWKNLKGGSSEGWDLIYFIANPMEIDLPFSEFNKLFEYKENYSLRGLTLVGDEKLKQFYAKYDDLYSIFERIKLGERPFQKEDSFTYQEYEEEKMTVGEKDNREMIDDKDISEHIRMQWELLLLGLKAGSKVWIPKSDQSKITREFDFKDFEEEFTAGIDVPSKYVDNIDVVWKEEFRIDAAFEVENTTSIYSGLLRFSDLKIIAPNSIYPLFIVAPLSKKNRLIQQIKRPTFKKLEFHKKVRYLSYEDVDEIVRFFERSSSGLNIDLLWGKSEAISS